MGFFGSFEESLEILKKLKEHKNRTPQEKNILALAIALVDWEMQKERLQFEAAKKPEMQN